MADRPAAIAPLRRVPIESQQAKLVELTAADLVAVGCLAARAELFPVGA